MFCRPFFFLGLADRDLEGLDPFPHCLRRFLALFIGIIGSVPPSKASFTRFLVVRATLLNPAFAFLEIASLADISPLSTSPNVEVVAVSASLPQVFNVRFARGAANLATDFRTGLANDKSLAKIPPIPRPVIC